jgi:hypothetical protein
MGVFDCVCVESGLPIDSDQQLVVILQTPAKTWRPIALPIHGNNNRYGTMDEPRALDANMKAVVAFGRQLVFGDASKPDDLAAQLEVIRADGPGGRLDGARVSFALVEATIYEAIVKTVVENGAPAWTRYARVALGEPRPPLPRQAPAPERPAPEPRLRALCEQLIATPTDEGTRKVFLDYLLERDDAWGKLIAFLPTLSSASFDDIASLVFGATPDLYAKATAKPQLRAALVELARFRAWGTELMPSAGAAQFMTWDGTEYGSVEPYFIRAKAMYAGATRLRAAIAEVESAWKARLRRR